MWQGQARSTTLDSVDLMHRWVELYLNGHHLDVIPRLFTTDYHDPIPVPATKDPHTPTAPLAMNYLRAIATFLASETVDVAFTLEDAFAVEDRLAYRLFGEGTVGLARQSSGLGSEPSLTDAVHITYQSVGMFRLQRGKLAERWGHVFVF